MTPSGSLRIAFKGKSVASLKAGRYAISVVDRSSSSGFAVKGKRATVSITGMAFVGKRTVTLNLTAGRWSFGPTASKSTYSVPVIP